MGPRKWRISFTTTLFLPLTEIKAEMLLASPYVDNDGLLIMVLLQGLCYVVDIRTNVKTRVGEQLRYYQ